MKKQLFSVMLCLGAMGGLSTFPMPLQAAVSQSQTIKVKGQIVDDQGEPLTGATIKIKGGLLEPPLRLKVDRVVP